MQSSMISDLQDVGALQSRPEELVRRWLKYSDLYHVSWPTSFSWATGSIDFNVLQSFERIWMEAGSEISTAVDPFGMSSHCHRLKKATKDAKTMREHCEAADDLLRHLAGQWADRSVYWQSRARAKTSRDILTMIGDGMDKSKYRLPRWTGGRAPVESFFGRSGYFLDLLGNLSDIMLFCCCCVFLVSLSCCCCCFCCLYFVGCLLFVGRCCCCCCCCCVTCVFKLRLVETVLPCLCLLTAWKVPCDLGERSRSTSRFKLCYGSYDKNA